MSETMKGSLITIILLGGIVMSFCAFWYWATFVQESLQKVLDESYGGSRTTQEEKLRALRKEARDTAESRNKLRALAVAEDQVPNLLNVLETLSMDTVPIFIRGVNLQADQGMVSVSLMFSGSMKEVMSIIGELTVLDYASYIDSLEIRTGKQPNGDIIQDTKIRLMIPLLALNET